MLTHISFIIVNTVTYKFINISFLVIKIIKILSPIVTMLAFLWDIDLVILTQLKLGVYKFNSQI